MKTRHNISSRQSISIILTLIASGFFGVMLPGAHAQSGGILKEGLTIESQILDTTIAYSVYLPPDYNHSERSYPVLYLLHGFTDDHTGWTQFGEVKRIMDREVNRTAVTPMIIVMPDGDVSWYINNYNNRVKYEDFFTREFMPEIENTYRIRAERQFRALSGLSMGGYGALVLALKNPALFSASAPLSAGIFTQEQIVDMPDDNWNNVFGLPFGKNRKGKQRLTAHYLNHSVLHLIEHKFDESFKDIRFYIDCGDDDFLIKGNMALHAAMIDKNMEHEFRVRNGGHTWSYWRSALPKVLEFVSEGFHR